VASISLFAPLNDVCNMQHKADKACAFKRKQGTTGGVDLMIVDIPEGLPMIVADHDCGHSRGRRHNS
jgi:hypothetical protein